ncbi:alpha/beta fold hydrolase [Promicromonospora sp. NPDC019610]|uniref:alpha/beta fold hydrolase n=1 Tax=Promicromonospora sp. NPDC019610 TaxID=3364405 RepID=UPI00378BD992
MTLADHAARVIEVLERAKKNGPVILVGHSRAGMPLTAVGNARPDLVDRIVYVSAWAPVDLDAAGYYAAPGHPARDGPRAAAEVLAGSAAGFSGAPAAD